MRATILAGVVAVILTASGCTTTDSSAKATIGLQPTVLVGEVVRIMATVEAVDKENRILALRGRSGAIATVKIDPALENFDRIQRGDRVVTEYIEEVAIYVDAPGSVSRDSVSRDVRTSAAATAPGATRKPSAVLVDTLQRHATVEAIDYDRRVVSLRTSDGSLQTIRLSPRVGSLEKISQGNRVTVRYTQIVAVGVVKAAP